VNKKLVNSAGVSFQNSLIVKAATFTLAMFLLSLLVYLYATFRSFSASYDWIKTENVSASVKEYMLSLKDIDQRERKDIESKISEILEKSKSQGFYNYDKNSISDILEKDLSGVITFDTTNLSQLTSLVTKTQLNDMVEWNSRSSIRILNFSADVKHNLNEIKYRRAESKLRKMKIFEAKMINDLVNGLFKIAGFVSSLYLLIITIMFIKKGRDFNRRMGSFYKGLRKWSLGEFGHREQVAYQDELGVIQAHFNEMAEEVEKGRKKSIDLEKISHWQTIAKKMAHEIKNPLTPIQLIFSSVKRSYKGDDEKFKSKLSDSYALILEEVAGLRRLVDSFTKFSSLPVAKPERVDLVSTIDKVIKKYKPLNHPHELLFESKLSSDSLEWRHDPGLLSQVLSNLVKNSIEACGDAPSQILIELSIDNNEFAVIKVNDNGPGVPADIQGNVFDPHFSTKQIGSSKNISGESGMGLGLSVCQKVIYDHGGEISLASCPFNTTFTITLPK
jgi:nitrogen fixation/metabolism regulation signal transduction histidine kinase